MLQRFVVWTAYNKVCAGGSAVFGGQEGVSVRGLVAGWWLYIVSVSGQLITKSTRAGPRCWETGKCLSLCKVWELESALVQSVCLDSL